MQKNRNLIFFILSLAATGATAQAIKTNCFTYGRQIFVLAEEGAYFPKSLDKYFKKAVPHKANRQEGGFSIKLIIDSVGKLDCLTIKDKTTDYTPEEISGCISGMPEWLPARQNGKPVNFCALIEVTVHKGKPRVSYLNENPHKPQ